MRILLIICFMVSILSEKVGAQCPTSNVSFKSQDEVDNFPITFPNCKQLPRNLTITGNILSLDSLKQLTSVITLTISSTTELINLEGLSNLKTLNTLLIIGNSELMDIDALENITKINEIDITTNPKLKTINGFNLIKDIRIIRINDNARLASMHIGSQVNNMDELTINSNPKLLVINGFDSLSWIKNTIALKNLFELATINAFGKLGIVVGTITIDNLGVSDLSCFANLRGVNNINITKNMKLTSLSHLTSLVQCGGLNIASNLSLTSLKGFQPKSINNLTIDSNPVLKQINCLDSLQYLNSLSINNNTILNSITFNGPPLTLKVLRIYNQNNLLNLNSINIKEVENELNIQNNLLLEEASSLSRIKGLHGIVYFDNNPALTNLAFDSLRVTLNPIALTVINHALIERISIPNFSNFKLSGLMLRVNPELKSFTAPEVISVDYIVIIENNKLSELASFKNLNTIKTALNISNNANIRDIQFLNKVSTANNITIVGNTILQDLKGLDNLAIANSILIEDNDSLKEIFSVNCQYKSITELISIINNDKLTGLDFTNNVIRFNQLNIQENDELTYIKLGEIIATDPIQINITDNANLIEIEANQIQYIKSLNIISNSKLKHLGSYDRLYKIEFLRIELNPALQILSGLDTLVHVVDLSIVQNDNLKSLKEMHELKQINGNLNISNNSNLIELFEDVQKVFNNTNITNNAVLTDISGLRNCNKLANLVLVNNPNLEECAIQSICDALANNAQIYIYNNKAGCNSNNEVNQKCIKKAETIYPNPAHNQLKFFVTPNQYTMRITIYDVQGRLIHHFDTMQPNIDISGLTNGIYFFEVASEKLNFKQRFVKY